MIQAAFKPGAFKVGAFKAESWTIKGGEIVVPERGGGHGGPSPDDELKLAIFRDDRELVTIMNMLLESDHGQGLL